MKKLTAGIFATLLAVVSADSAYAAIASKGYVDDQVGEVQTAVTAVESDVTALQATVGEHTTQIAGKADSSTVTALQTKVDGKQDALGFAPENSANKTTTLSGTSTDTQYPSAKAVWDTIQTETEGIANEADVTDLKGRVSTLETASAKHVVKNEAITGGTHTKITYDAKGLVTAGANLTAEDIPTIPNTKVSGLGSLATLDAVGSAQITDGAVATADIANKAVTKAKLADDIVTSLGRADSALQQADLADYVTETEANAAYAVKTLETQVGTVSKENMGTTTATTVVAGVKEAIDAAKAADTKAGQAKTAATTAQGAAEAAQADVDALEETVSGQGTRLTTAEGEIDTIQGKISNMATSDTVTKLTERVTTAESDITALETAVNDAESGLAATNAIADNALSTAQSAKTTADAALPETTYNTQVGTVTAGNMGTSATTVVAAIKEVAGEAAAAQKTANAAIPAPDGECSNPTNKCVLTFNNSAYAWEVIVRGEEGE